jgi:malate permease and related proteins
VLIIYNMVFYQQGSLWLVGLSFVSSIIFFSAFYLFGKDKLQALCLSYLNGAWLGLPFALAVFGKEATNTIVALYIGGSLFGNICAVMAVSQDKQSAQFIVKNVLQSPPVIALTLAGVLSFWDFSAYQQHQAIEILYGMNKFLVTFAGMCVLGMWLSKVKIQLHDLVLSLQLILTRMLMAILICIAAYYILPIPHHVLTYAVIFMFFCLPPAANIVALETHYQGTGNSAKYIASGTIASALIISIYGIVLHSLGVLN